MGEETNTSTACENSPNITIYSTMKFKKCLIYNWEIIRSDLFLQELNLNINPCVMFRSAFIRRIFCIRDLGCLFSRGVLLGGGGGLLSELYSITHSVNYVSAGCCRGPLSEHRKPDWLRPLQEGCWKEDQNFCWKLLGKTTPQSGILSSFKEY